MVRLRPKEARPIKIWRVEHTNQPGQEDRELVDAVLAEDLPQAIRRWTEDKWDEAVWVDALYRANTVSIVTRLGREETYVATD